MFSPRTWRCFRGDKLGWRPSVVFSTHVEMFHCLCHVCRAVSSFLHARGDVSAAITGKMFGYGFSPRTWRCFYLSFAAYSCRKVFSTHVEMFPQLLGQSQVVPGFLHALSDWPINIWNDISKGNSLRFIHVNVLSYNFNDEEVLFYFWCIYLNLRWI